MERLNQWLSLIANIGVLVSIAFLAVEISQNSDMIRAQTRSGISNSIIENIELRMDSRATAGYKRMESGEELTFEDRSILDSIANATLRLWENTHYQWRSGLFDDEEFQADLVVWRETMQSPEYKSHWKQRRNTYSAAFRNEIHQLVE